VLCAAPQLGETPGQIVDQLHQGDGQRPLERATRMERVDETIIGARLRLIRSQLIRWLSVFHPHARVASIAHRFPQGDPGSRLAIAERKLNYEDPYPSTADAAM